MHPKLKTNKTKDEHVTLQITPCSTDKVLGFFFYS